MIPVEDSPLQFFVGGYHNSCLHHPDSILKGRLFALFPFFHQRLVRALVVNYILTQFRPGAFDRPGGIQE